MASPYELGNLRYFGVQCAPSGTVGALPARGTIEYLAPAFGEEGTVRDRWSDGKSRLGGTLQAYAACCSITWALGVGRRNTVACVRSVSTCSRRWQRAGQNFVSRR